MASYFIEGPLDDGTSVMLCILYQSVPYYLCNSGGNYVGLQYSNDMNISTFKINVISYPDKSSDPVIFTLQDQLYSKNVMVNTDTNIINLASGDQNLSAYSTKYQKWYQVPFLAGETYQMTSNQNTTIIVYDENLNPIPFTIVYVIPTRWYQQGACKQARDYSSALSYNQMSLTGNNTTMMGWTTINECNNNIDYTYCNNGYNCSSQCKASCQNPSYSCDWSVKAQSFQCNRGPDGFFNQDWWSSIWFLTIISVILIVAIISYIVMIISRRNKSSNEVEFIEGSPYQIVNL